MKTLVQIVVLLVLGTLVAKAALITSSPKSQGIKKGNVVVNGKGPINGQSPVKGQDPVKSQDPVKGQGRVKGQDPVKGQDLIVGEERARLPFKRGTCPRVLIRCALWNPPNKCLRDAQCPGAKKCCEGFCGKTCMDPR